MALVTRCPNCATTFRVTPLHLQAHGGDVRCGRCAQIFNGFSTLATMQEPEAVDLTERTDTDKGEDTQAARPSGVDDLRTSDLPNQDVSPTASDDEKIPSSDDEKIPSSDDGKIPPGIMAEAVTRELPSQEPQVADGPNHQASDTTSTRQSYSPRNYAEKNHVAEGYTAEDEAAERYAFDATPERKNSLAWGLASLLLLLVLAAQAIYFYRAELSVIAPDAKPYLEQYCELLQCTIPLPQNAALLSIESSEMLADTQRSGVVTLIAAVRNHAPYPQAFPSFELTLTDAGDQPLASHIFTPDRYLGENMDPAGAIAPDYEFNVKLHFDSGDLNAAGYRLSLFYPGA